MNTISLDYICKSLKEYEDRVIFEEDKFAFEEFVFKLLAQDQDYYLEMGWDNLARAFFNQRKDTAQWKHKMKLSI